jgi:hypothetical protein
VSYDLSGSAIASAVLRVPRWGAWLADVMLVETPTLTVGSSVVLTLGNLALTGTLLPGGVFGGIAQYSVIGGAGKWNTQVGARSYSNTNGVRLSQVASDLAKDAGELGTVLQVADRVLGGAWVRPAGIASELLRALTAGQWWIDGTGNTNLGPRPATQIAPSTITIGNYDPELKRATAALSDDAVAQLLPGAVLTANGLPATLPIDSLIVRVADNALEVELYGQQGLAELFAGLVASLTSGTRYHPAIPGAVVEVSSTTATVRPTPALAATWPTDSYLPQIPGVPGLSAVLQPGAGVLVAFPAGDPGSPSIVAFLPGTLPVSLVLDATTTVSLGAGGTPLASGNAADANFLAISVALAALGRPVTMTPTRCTKAMGV